MTELNVEKHNVEISHPGKIIFPELGLTKKDVANYYRKISEHIMPYLQDRPMVLHRYPEGVGQPDFYQKDVPGYFPSWINTIKVEVKEKGRQPEHLVNCDNTGTLLYIINQGCITPHVWLSKSGHLERPDRMIFDLDPPEGQFELVRMGARELKKIFDALGLPAFLMTTGSKGVHIVIPLDGRSSFAESRDFAFSVARFMSNKYSDRYTTETRKDKRAGRLFIDYLRNSYGQTGVAPYSLRARHGAPVATPLEWNEIGRSDLTAVNYHYGNIFRRMAAREDPWKNFKRHKTGLKRASKKLAVLMEEGER